MSELLDKLDGLKENGRIPMHMPGHKRNVQLLGNRLPIDKDITEIDGFDDLHDAQDLLKRVQDEAARLYGVEKSYMLIGGSTCGILAGIYAALKGRNPKIIMARECHKAVYHAVEINNLETVYLYSALGENGILLNDYTRTKGIAAGGAKVAEVSKAAECEEKNAADVASYKRALEENKDAALLVLTSPNYEGIICKNLKEIIELAHSYKIPVLVDEAHGAHLLLDEELKESDAIRCGADLVVMSLHKTLPAMTQTALLHLQGDLIKAENVDHALDVFETSSPSYILMASVAECIEYVKNEGKSRYRKYKEWLEEFYAECRKLKHIRLLDGEMLKGVKKDTGKVVILGQGRKIAECLRENYKTETEMSSSCYALAMTTLCDKKEDIDSLLKALRDMDEKYPELGDAPITKSCTIAPEKRMSIREALLADGKRGEIGLVSLSIAVDEKTDTKTEASDEVIVEEADAKTGASDEVIVKVADAKTKVSDEAIVKAADAKSEVSDEVIVKEADAKTEVLNEVIVKAADDKTEVSDEFIAKMEDGETGALAANKVKKADGETIYTKAGRDQKEMVSLEYIGAYPPGIPLVVPGEVITRELLEEIKGLEKAGIYVKTSGRCYPKVKVIK